MAKTATVRQRRTGSPPADPFAIALARFDDARLAELFERRPDLVDPPPRDLAEVLRRAASPTSVYRAVDHLDELAWHVVRAVLASGGASSADSVAGLLGLHHDDDALAGALIRVVDLLLGATGPGGAFYTHPALGQVLPLDELGPPVAELLKYLTVDELRWVARHRPVSDAATRKAELLATLAKTLADGADILRVLSQAPPAAARMAERLARHDPRIPTSPFGIYPRVTSSRAARTDDPVQWLAWHGLVVRDNWFGCIMPREVIVTLRGGQPFGPVRTERPAVHGERPAQLSTGGPGVEGFDAAATIVDQVEAVVDGLDATPVTMLKTGGLGVRQLRRLAKDADMPEDRAALAVEIADLAGLIARRVSAQASQVRPTTAFDTWANLDMPQKWAWLAVAWFTGERFASLAGTRDVDGKPHPALSHPVAVPEAASQRRVVLRLLAELPDGTVPDRSSLTAAAQWQTPLAIGVGPLDAAGHVAWVLDEATALGLVHHDALSALGRQLVAGEINAAAELLADHTPRAATGLVLQADLTAIGPAVSPRWFRERMRLLADVESTGATVVYRFSDTTVRRAMDAGLSADDILGFLQEHASSGVPQPLGYLVGDAARRHGTIRAGAATSYVRCADEATAVELARGRRTAELGLRSIAPTVLVSDAEPATVVAVLRRAGYSPAHEDIDGTLVTARPAAPRADAVGRTGPPVPPAGRGAAVEQARRLLKGEAPQGEAPQGETAAWQTGRPGGGPAALPPLLLGAAEAVGIDDDEIVELLELLTGEGPSSACACQRPTAIASERPGIDDLLRAAMGHQWTIRMALSRRGKQPQSFFAEVEDLDGEDVRLWRHDHDRPQPASLATVAWARVLTEAEELQLFAGGVGR